MERLLDQRSGCTEQFKIAVPTKAVNAFKRKGSLVGVHTTVSRNALRGLSNFESHPNIV